MMKLGFLFGAGAEFDYKMPSGGTFALEIFRQDSMDAKSKFKQMRDEVNSRSRYAATWLPDDYMSKNIGSYGKSVFEAIIKDTIEHNRDNIINKLNSFDLVAGSLVQRIKKTEGIDVDEAFKDIIEMDVRDVFMQQDIKYVDIFSDGDRIFSNHYFGALLQVYLCKDKLDSDIRIEIRRILIAILQLQVGALGENLSRKINDNLFSKKIDEIDIFDDLGELVQLNYQSTGVAGLEYLLDNKKSNTTSPGEKILFFAQELLEDIFSSVLDYKTLIDSNWHFLYCPKAEWAKFCKISIFLLTVRNYIDKQCRQADFTAEGYYNDLNTKLSSPELEITAIATTNYTGIISNIIASNITFLNGSTNLWYDPYVNRIGKETELDQDHFKVPLLFTQSGTKPMTSIDMSIQYVDMYRKFEESDYICCIGFGFNPDDEHINGILRALIDKGKKMIVVRPGGNHSDIEIQTEIADRLKVKNRDNIEVLLVDKNRSKNGQNWLDFVLAK